jgi:hypothetical protein
MAVTDGRCRFRQNGQAKRGLTMKKIALVFALAFAFTTGMAAVTVVGHTDQAMAHCRGGSCSPYGT